MLADFLGFLYTQEELVERSPTAGIDEEIALDIVHLTAAPPTVTRARAIVDEISWLYGKLSCQRAKVLYAGPDGAKLGNVAKTKALKVIFGLQHPPEDATSVGDLVRLSDLGVRFMTLAYEGENAYGSGFANPQGPLTRKGEWLLRVMRASRMIVDLSHAGWRTAGDALATIEKGDISLPVVASHSGCAMVHYHLRNLPDDVMRRIATAHGGLIGIPTATWMLSESDDTLAPYFRHMEHALRLVGEDAVAVGSDGTYKTINPKKQLAQFIKMREKFDKRGNFGARFPDQPPELNTPRRMEILRDHLEKEFGARIAVKVCGDNLVKFLAVHLA